MSFVQNPRVQTQRRKITGALKIPWIAGNSRNGQSAAEVIPGSETIRKEYTQASGSREHITCDDMVRSIW